MKRLLRSWVFWGTCLALVPAAYTILGGFCGETRMYECFCGSDRTVSQWVWSWSFGENVWSGQASIVERPSALSRDCFPEGHVHAWGQRYGGGSGLLGGGWNACHGRGAPTALAMKYDQDEDFRLWLKRELEAGRLSREDVERESTLSRAPFGYSR